MAESADFGAKNKKLILVDGIVDCDCLLVSASATHSYFGKDEWADLAPWQKTVAGATFIRCRIYHALEAAEPE